MHCWYDIWLKSFDKMMSMMIYNQPGKIGPFLVARSIFVFWSQLSCISLKPQIEIEPKLHTILESEAKYCWRECLFLEKTHSAAKNLLQLVKKQTSTCSHNKNISFSSIAYLSLQSYYLPNWQINSTERIWAGMEILYYST